MHNRHVSQVITSTTQHTSINTKSQHRVLSLHLQDIILRFKGGGGWGKHQISVLSAPPLQGHASIYLSVRSHSPPSERRTTSTPPVRRWVIRSPRVGPRSHGVVDIWRRWGLGPELLTVRFPPSRDRGHSRSPWTPDASARTPQPRRTPLWNTWSVVSADSRRRTSGGRVRGEGRGGPRRETFRRIPEGGHRWRNVTHRSGNVVRVRWLRE